MKAAAAKAGYFVDGNERQFPRIQILTIDDILSGRKRPEFVDYGSGREMYREAKKELPEGTREGQDKLI